jgi:hypothetical protein
MGIFGRSDSDMLSGDCSIDVFMFDGISSVSSSSLIVIVILSSVAVAGRGEDEIFSLIRERVKRE